MTKRPDIERIIRRGPTPDELILIAYVEYLEALDSSNIEEAAVFVQAQKRVKELEEALEDCRLALYYPQ